MGDELAASTEILAPRVLIFGGFLLIALGTAVALWLERHGPSRILGYEAAYVVGLRTDRLGLVAVYLRAGVIPQRTMELSDWV